MSKQPTRPGTRFAVVALTTTFAVATALYACNGHIGDPGDSPGAGGYSRGPGGGGAGDGTGTGASPGEGIAGPTGATALRLLTRREYEATISDVFGLAGVATKYLPPDTFAPYDTDATTKQASAVLIEGVESLAYALAKSVSTNNSIIGRFAGCATSASDSDTTCLTTFVNALGRRLLRRPLKSAETSALVTKGIAFSKERKDFKLAVRFAVQTLLQHPSFVYRLEQGSDVGGGKYKLDNYEIITRLSYLLWGTTPDKTLLDAAAGPELTKDKIKQLVSAMLADKRANEQIVYFHELWLGYKGLRVPANLQAPMLAETDALLRRVLTGNRRPWTQIFTSGETFVDAALAAHYGMDPPVSGSGWVGYKHAERAGVLSHGSVLSLASRNTDDTSPTIRGKYVATRILCRTVPPPPPNVNVDDPPKGDANTCKSDAYKAHQQKGSPCFTCHAMMDPIGFGLERFDGLGRYRTVEKVNKSCNIDGQGELGGTGKFSGVKQLVALMVRGDELRKCAVKQLFHFAMGRQAGSDDQAQLDRLSQSFKASGDDFRQLVTDLITDPNFQLRIDSK